MSNEKNMQEERAENVVKESAAAEAAATRSEKNGDVSRDDQTEARAAYISSIVALLLTIVFYGAQYFISGTPNYGLCATVFGMLAAEKIVIYAKRKGRRHLVLAILYTLLTVSCTALTFAELLK